MTEQTASEKKKKRLFTLIRVVVSVGLLGFLFYSQGLGNILNAIRSADLLMVGLILVAMTAEHLHGTYKWMILLRHTETTITFWQLIKIRYLSAFLGIFGLGAVTIEVVRMYGLARYTSNLAMSFTSILMDRLLGLTGLSLMILFGVVLESRSASTVGGIEYWAGGALAGILVGWLAIMNPGFRNLTDKMLSPRWLRMVRDKQNKVYQSLDTYRGRSGLLAWGMVQSIIFNLLRIGVVILGAKAVGVEAPTSAYFVVVPAVIFAMLIPISMSGWGVREAMFAGLLPLYGADKEAVIAMSLLIGVCGILSTLPGVVILMTGSGLPKPGETPTDTSEQP